MFWATILRPFTSARNYATLSHPKRQCGGIENACFPANAAKATALEKQNAENENQRVESRVRRKKRQPSPKRFSGGGSAPPRFRFGFFRVSFRGVCLAAAGFARRTCLCQAHATVPNNSFSASHEKTKTKSIDY